MIQAKILMLKTCFPLCGKRVSFDVGLVCNTFISLLVPTSKSSFQKQKKSRPKAISHRSITFLIERFVVYSIFLDTKRCNSKLHLQWKQSQETFSFSFILRVQPFWEYLWKKMDGRHEKKIPILKHLNQFFVYINVCF